MEFGVFTETINTLFEYT